MKSWRIVLAAVALMLFVSASTTCPFCDPKDKGPTVTADYSQAATVVLGHVENGPVQDANGVYYTEVTIDEVIKPNNFLKDKKTFKLRRAIEKGPSQILFFCDINSNKLDSYRHLSVVPKGDMVKYLQGSLANKDKPIADRLRYAFDYLDNADPEVSKDAFREFAIADYKDYMTMAKDLPADRIAGWLRDARTQPMRYGLYSSLLGHCGTAEHAKVLRKKIEDNIKEKGLNLDGLLAGYVMLQPKEGWAFAGDLLRDGKEDYQVRYSVVRTATFLREQRPDLVPEKELASTVALVLQSPDLADHGIEFLRKAKAWDMTGRVLDLYGKKDYDNDFMKRSILSFALSCPEERAAAFVKDMRSRNADFVNVTAELLKREQ
jgi:hypothetical protein